jgi:hypothetical protein
MYIPYFQISFKDLELQHDRRDTLHSWKKQMVLRHTKFRFENLKITFERLVYTSRLEDDAETNLKYRSCEDGDVILTGCI